MCDAFDRHLDGIVLYACILYRLISCLAFPTDLQYYSPTVSVNVSLAATLVENWEQPLQLRIVFDNTDRCLLVDLDSLRVGLTWGAI